LQVKPQHVVLQHVWQSYPFSESISCAPVPRVGFQDVRGDVSSALRPRDRLVQCGLVWKIWAKAVRDRHCRPSSRWHRHASRFTDHNDLQLIEYWRQRTAGREETIDLVARLSVRVPRMLEAARITGDWSQIPAMLKEIAADAGTIHFLLPACQTLAGAGQWSLINPYIDILENRIGTAEALRIAAFTSYNSADPRRALALIDAYSEASGSPTMPLNLRRLHAESKQSIGDVAGALANCRVDIVEYLH
jgi:hypothetical protein